MLLPVLPAKSLILKTMLLPLRVAPSQVIVVPLTLLVMSVKLVPPSTEPYKMSPTLKVWLNVAVMVCEATLVNRSVLLVPVSEPSATLLTVRVGAVWSTVKVALFLPTVPVLPAKSV